MLQSDETGNRTSSSEPLCDLGSSAVSPERSEPPEAQQQEERGALLPDGPVEVEPNSPHLPGRVVAAGISPDEDWEIALDRLEISSQELGCGEFGVVKKGVYRKRNHEVIDVAVKMTRGTVAGHAPDRWLAMLRGFLFLVSCFGNNIKSHQH